MRDKEEFLNMTADEIIDNWQELFNILFNPGNFDNDPELLVYKDKIEDIMRKGRKIKLYKQLYKQAEISYNKLVSEAIGEPQQELPPYLTINEQTNTYHFSGALYADYFSRTKQFKLFGTDNTNIIYLYTDRGYYEKVGKPYITGIIKAELTSIGKKALNALNSRNINDAYTLITASTSTESIEKMPDMINEGYINFQNGLLELATMKLLPHTSDIFTINQIPCDWTGKPSETPYFNKILNDMFGEREDSKTFVKEWIGLIISNISFTKHNFKKALLMVGAGDSGKSQLKKLTEYIIGSDNCSAIDMRQLEKEHMTAAIVGKRLIGSSDMKVDNLDEVTTFMQIIGGDNIHVNVKCGACYTTSFNGYVWNCCNNLPNPKGEMVNEFFNRLIILRLNPPLPENERDADLQNKLQLEIPGIMFKCVQAVKELIKRGYKLTIPKENTENVDSYKLSTNYAAAFYNECCTPYVDGVAGSSTQEIKAAFEEWYSENVGSGHIPTVNAFNKNLAGYLNISIDKLFKRFGSGNERRRCYCFSIAEREQNSADYGVTETATGHTITVSGRTFSANW